MLKRKMRDFVADEDGGYTAWFVVWFALYVAMGGLAVDVGDAFRSQTQLQSTADAAALAGAYSLPNTASALNNAVGYARANMEVAINGHVVMPSDVSTGNWNFSTKNFTANGTPVNAVHVIARRGNENGNPLATNLLRIIGLDRFNINTEAVAVRYVPACEQQGLWARGGVEISSNNKFVGDICIHGVEHIKIQNNNDWAEGVHISTTDLDNFAQMEKRLDPTKNPGLDKALREGDLDLTMVDKIDTIIATLAQRTVNGVTPAPDGILNPDTGFDVQIVPNYVDGTIHNVTLAEFEAMLENPNDANWGGKSGIVTGSTVDGKIVLDKDGENKEIPGAETTFFVDCPAETDHVNIPGGLILKDMVVVTDCTFHIGDSLLTDVTLAAFGGKIDNVDDNTFNFSSKTQLGLEDGCAPGGGARIYSTHSIHAAAQMKINGVQMLAKGDIHISAQADGANGIAAQAGGDIKLTSKNVYGLCDGGVDGIFATWNIRLAL